MPRSHLPLLLLAVAACQDARPRATEGPPKRIVSLAPSVTEVLFALGAGEHVVGVTRFCDYPPETARLPKIGGYVDPSVEAVSALRPDLVVTVQAPANRRPVEALRGLGRRVELVSDRTLADVRSALRAVGGWVGALEAARREVARLDAGLEAVQAAVAGRPRPRTLLVYGHRPLVVAAPGSYAGELLALAGGDNVVPDGDGYPLFSMERALTLAPEVVIDVAMAPAGASESDVRELWGRWPSLPAVAAGRIHALDQGPLMRPGPRAPAAARALANALHPGLRLR